MDTQKCSKCGMATEGYKCDMCGAESAQHDASHACGADKCVGKCLGCNEAHTKCSCPMPAEPTPPAEGAAL